MKKKFAEYTQFNLSDVNKEVLKMWDENHIFERSVTEREGCSPFVFFEGPPSANGMPGIHHVMARSIKDLICRYKTMKGYQVKRKAGWDTHGLPVELSVEKTLKITKDDIGKTISVVDYNKHCREDVMKFTKEWADLTHKMGYWVDTKDPYITYDNRYIETLWWLLKQLYNKGLLYKGYTIQPYSPAAGTGLSSHELNQPGCYRDVKDTTVTAQFKISDPKNEWAKWGTPYFVAWTTTPWTLPSNTALCVGPKIDYVAVKTYNMYTAAPITVIMAKARVDAYFNSKGADASMDGYKHGDKIIPYRVIAEYKGTDLIGYKYEQLFPWVKPMGEDAFRVISGDYVTTEDGTGIVHIAPTFGADDASVAKASGIPPLQLINKKGEKRPMVDLAGKYYLLSDLDDAWVEENVDKALYKVYEGRFVKNDYDPNLTEKDETLDISMCMEMKANNLAFKIEKHVHSYPHCWRTDKPILYYPLDSWFIKSTACKDKMISLNKTINWKPESTGTGRFGKWLENLNDWNLSRSRFWGTPLPIWRTDDNEEEICIESVAQLYDEIEKSVKAGLMKTNPLKERTFVPGEYNKDNYDKIDLHRPYVDDIILVSKAGKPMKRETDLIDVWFDSGSMPYAQIHYPFENKEILDSHQVYPADFIAEGVDQTRGWFFTLHAISSMIFGNVAYKNVISNGLVLDKNGNKMSKRLGNAVDPFKEIEKFGSDPLRWYMITNSSPWDNLKFDEEGVDEVRRKFFGTLYNTYSFFALYANVDEFDYSQEDISINERKEIDRWIISELNSLIKAVDANLADYEPTKAGRLISDFVSDNLSNWYVRLCRKRFWGGGMSKDKLAAYQTLYTCLETVAKLMAPISPFYADRLYGDLISVTGRENYVSVHLAKYPVADESLIDKELEARMEVAQKVTSMVLALRRKVNIKVRQPLQCIMIPVIDDEQKQRISSVRNLIINEVNVKEIQFAEENNDILVRKVKCDFKKLGPKFGKQMKKVASLISGLSQQEISLFDKDGYIDLKMDDNEEVRVILDDVEIISEDIPGWLVSNEGRLTVALEITITEALHREGIARELVNRIQNLRKSNGYEITDKIKITLSKNQASDAAILEYNKYICKQVLGKSLHLDDNIVDGTELEFDDFSLFAKIIKDN
jgi:isoleucyl-tRNA synthetase